MGSGDQSGYFDGFVTTLFGPLLDRGVRLNEGGIAEGELRAVGARQVLLAIYSTAKGDLADAPFISLASSLEDEALESAQVKPAGRPCWTWSFGRSGSQSRRYAERINQPVIQASLFERRVPLPSNGGLLENYPHG